MDTHQKERGFRIHPALTVAGILSLIVVGLILILALATAVALILGYACLIGALLLLGYWLLKRWWRKRSDPAAPES